MKHRLFVIVVLSSVLFLSCTKSNNSSASNDTTPNFQLKMGDSVMSISEPQLIQGSHGYDRTNDVITDSSFSIGANFGTKYGYYNKFDITFHSKVLQTGTFTYDPLNPNNVWAEGETYPSSNFTGGSQSSFTLVITRIHDGMVDGTFSGILTGQNPVWVIQEGSFKNVHIIYDAR